MSSKIESRTRNISEVSVRRIVTFSMIYLMVVGFGIFSFMRLKLDLFPDLTFPYIGIVVMYEGTAPQDIEQLVTKNVEEAVASVEGVKEINSESKYGASIVNVEFDWGTDIDQAETDIRRNLDMYRDSLPDGVSDPIVFAFDPSMQPILFFGLNGPFNQAQLRHISEKQLVPLIERIPGVASAETVGGLKREVQVVVRPQDLEARSMSILQIVEALRRENVQLPSGSIIEGDRRISILTHGEFFNIEDIKNVVVTYQQGVPVRIRDIADVVDSFHEVTRIVRSNYKPSVMLIIRKQSGANTVQVVNNVLSELPNIRRAMPAGLTFNTAFDQAEIVKLSLGNLGTSGLIAIALTFLVLLFFLLDFRASTIVALSIPVSLIVTFGVMDQSGVTLNVISMAGLALAIGMLVDNSIVVLENIYRHFQEGESAIEASINGTKEVGMAITASTLTTVAVFFPVLFVPGIAGAMFKDMALTICFSLGASLLVALTLVPMLASRILVRNDEERKVTLGKKIAMIVFIVPAILWILKKIFLPVGKVAAYICNILINLIINTYSKLLNFVIRWRLTSIAIAVILLATSIYLASIVGTDFFPKEDEGFMSLQVKGSVGTNVWKMDEYFREAEKIVKAEVPEAKVVSEDYGLGEGFIALFNEGEHTGTIRVKLVPQSQRNRKSFDIEDDLREAMKKVPGIVLNVFQPFSLTGSADLEIQIFAQDLIKSRQVGMDIKKIVSKIDGVSDVKFSLEEETPQLQVYLNRAKMADLGLSVVSVNSTISSYFQGTVASIYREGGDEYDILVRAPLTYRKNRANIERVSLLTLTGKIVPMESIGNVREELAPLSITRRDQQRMVTVSINSNAKDLGGLTKRVEKALNDYSWPEDFRWHVGGTAEDLQESFFYLGIALLVAAFLVYMVMASQFESFLEPFVIFTTILFIPIGVGFILYLTKTPLSVMSLIGVIILIGIVVNNSIVLIDAANKIKDKGIHYSEAIKQAAKVRLRPVLMTALTTILSMVPLALEIGEGSEGWAPMAKVVIAGMSVCTFITLLIVPLFYKAAMKMVQILSK